MLLKRAATALPCRDDDLHIVFNEHTHRGEVDLAKHRLHQATGEESHTRTGGAMPLHEFVCIRGGALQNGRAALKKKPVHRQSETAQQSRGQQGKIEQSLIRNGDGSEAQRPLRREAMRGNVLMTDALEDFAIRHIGRAGGFTSKAANTLRRVKICPLILRQAPRRLLAPQAQATARRIVFITRELVSRAHRKAKAAVRAVGKVVLLLSLREL